MGKIYHLHTNSRALYLGDWKVNFNKRFELIERKKQTIEELKKSIKKGK